jgi:uncharacterized protein (DUF1330 family)
MPEDEYLEVWPGHYAGFMELPRDYPIDMLNLVRFRDRAEYPAGHPNAEAGLSGAEAWAIYTKESLPSFQRAGGTIIWSATMESMLIGPVAENWSLAFIGRYPNAEAFLKSITDPDYTDALVHRQAALATSRVICLKAYEPRAA